MVQSIKKNKLNFKYKIFFTIFWNSFHLSNTVKFKQGIGKNRFIDNRIRHQLQQQKTKFNKIMQKHELIYITKYYNEIR